MTLLFVGSEQEAFDLIGTAGITFDTATAGSFDATMSRGAIRVAGLGAAYARKTFSPQTSVWIHARCSIGIGSSFFNIINSSGTTVFRVSTSHTTGYANYNYKPEYYNGSSWITMGDSAVVPSSSVGIDFDVKINIATFGGAIDVYMDGVLMFSFSGNTSFLGSGISEFRMFSPDGSNVWFSQTIISTTITVGMKVATLSISGAGTTSQWVGSYTDINETVLSDTTFISDNTNGDISTYQVTDVPTGGNFNVGAIIVSARAERGATGVQNLELGVRSGGANHWGSPVSGLITAFGPFQEIMTTDPATGLPWTISGANAVEIGVQALT